MIALVLLILAVAVGALYVNGRRIRELTERLTTLERRDDERQRLVRDLIARIYALEQHPHREAAAPPPAPVVRAPSPAFEPPPAPLVRAPSPAFAPSPARAVEPAPAPAPVLARRNLRERLAEQQWEELIGANWLNKLGVLVLVIGIALGLAYSFTYMGPGGRVATALVVSLAMLGSGVVVERRAAYRVFARGLIGGGWAGLYFTTYAMYGLEPAKVISNAAVESVLLAAVACGMIAHSLRYRSQTVTGLAYFLAFAAMAVAPVTAFAIVALVPLTASLLYLADRFSWFRMAVGGVIATYAVCAARGDPHAALAPTQSIIAVYWLLFEGFVLLRIGRDRTFSPVERWIFPLNTVAATVLSVLKWHSSAPDRVWVFFAVAAAVHLAGTLARLHLRAEPDTEESMLRRAWSGGYESAATVAALFTALAICLGLHGAWIAPALLAEGELLFLIALRFRQPYLEGLGMGAFGAAVGRVLLLDVPEARRFTLFGRHILAWSPAAAAAGVLFYVDRLLRKSGAAYTWAAAGAFVTIALLQADFRYVGLWWLIFAAANLEAGIQWRLREFRLPAYVIGALGILQLAIVDVVFVRKPAELGVRVALFCATLLCYLVTARLLRPIGDRMAERDRQLVRDIASCAGTVFCAALVWLIAPDVLVAVGWTALAVLLVEAGFVYDVAAFRRQGDAVALLVFGRLFFANFTNRGTTVGISHRLLTVGPVIVAQYWAWIRYRQAAAGAFWDRIANRWYVWAAATMAVMLLRFELGRAATVLGWAALMLVLYWAGLRVKIDDLRRQALLLAAVTVWRAWATNLYLGTPLLGIPTRIWTTSAVIAALFGAQFLAPRTAAASSAWIDRHQRAYFSVLASGLLAVLLFYEVNGGLLTVAWGIEAVVLLAAGFYLRDSILRLSALVLFFVCIGKLFFYDLRNLETINRILSFIVLGGIMVGVSWLYTRFRNQIRKLL